MNAQFAATGLLHLLEHVGLHVGARVRGPRDLQAARHDLVAQLRRARRVRREGVVLEEHFAQIGERRLDVFKLVDHVLDRTLAVGVAGERLRNHAIRAAERAAATRKDHDQRVDVRAVEVTLVAREQMLAVDLAHPRQRVEVFDLRTLGILDVQFAAAVRDAEDLRRRIGAVAAQVTHQLTCRVVRLADDHIVDRGFALEHFDRLGGRVRSHHRHGATHGLLDGLGNAHVVVDGGRRRVEHRELGLERADLFKRGLEVEVHGRGVEQQQFVAVVLHAARRVRHEHGPVQRAGFRHAGAARFPREHREIRRVEKQNFHAGALRYAATIGVQGPVRGAS
jgi:hypothetical protein